MEESQVPPNGQVTKDRKSRRSNKILLVLATISIVVIVILSGFVLVGTGNNLRFQIGPDDYFHYDLSGQVNSTPVEGNMTVDLGAEQPTTIHYFGYMLPEAERGIYLLNDQVGSWVGDHRILTAWGEKTVKMYLKLDLPNLIVLTDVGIDSSIIYRTMIVSSNASVKSVLTASNNTNIQTSDTRISSDSAIGEWTVLGRGGTLHYFNPGEAALIAGSIKISEGQNLTYQQGIPETSLYFFTVQDLIASSNDGLIHYEPNISLRYNQTGMVSAKVLAGTYWYCLIRESGPEGIFQPYWRDNA
jgi:hypothetical protein